MPRKSNERFFSTKSINSVTNMSISGIMNLIAIKLHSEYVQPKTVKQNLIMCHGLTSYISLQISKIQTNAKE